MKLTKNALEAARKEIATIAFCECRSVAEIRSDIKKAIQYGMECSDPTVQELWKTIPHAGEFPEPEEVILWVITKLHDTANDPLISLLPTPRSRSYNTSPERTPPGQSRPR